MALTPKMVADAQRIGLKFVTVTHYIDGEVVTMLIATPNTKRTSDLVSMASFNRTHKHVSAGPYRPSARRRTRRTAA